LLALLGVIGAALYTLGSALPMLGLSVAFKNLTLPLLFFEIVIGFYLTFWPLKDDLAESA